MLALERTQYMLPTDQTVVSISCESAFKNLSSKDQLFVHYLSKAAWNGYLITLVQASPEAPLIFSLLHRVFAVENAQQLRTSARKYGISVDEFREFLVYASAVFDNAGNFRGFGNTKILPSLNRSKFETIIESSLAYRKNQSLQSLLKRVSPLIYSLKSRKAALGLAPNGVTAYWSDNCTVEDVELVNSWLMWKRIEPYMCRTSKLLDRGEALYDVKVASIDDGERNGITLPTESLDGCKFRVTRGDYSKLLQLVNTNLMKAKEYATHPTQVKMIQHYVMAFQDGSVADHKIASRYWLQNKATSVETYIGFSEINRDPAGVHAQFEGFVGVHNKEGTAKLARVVARAESLLRYLPWGEEYQNDVFLQPEFYSLDLLTFAGSSIPSSINLPTYEDVRYEVGFRNVCFNNVIYHRNQRDQIPFVTKTDEALLKKYMHRCEEVQMTLCQLFGHGCDKMFRVDKVGVLNFDREHVKSLTTGKPVRTWYQPGETFATKFRAISCSYEICRTTALGLYLSTVPDILRTFNHLDLGEQEKIMYANWLNLVWSGLFGLCMYAPQTRQWTQARAQAHFVILRVLLEAGNGLLQIEEIRDGTELLINLDGQKISKVKKALRDFLRKLQLFKSTGDIAAANELYGRYSAVDNHNPYPWLKWRNMCLVHKKPPPFVLQPNTKEQKGQVTLHNYEATLDGYIQSWADRFSGTAIDDILEEILENYRQQFPLNYGNSVGFQVE